MKTNLIRKCVFIAIIHIVMHWTMYADTPTAVAATSNITMAGTITYSFTVTYTAAAGINVSTLNNGDICIVNPGGNMSMTRFVSVNDNTNGTPRVATYSFVHHWTSGDNGTYAVLMHEFQVLDMTGTPVPEGDIGHFTVAIGIPPPTPTPTPSPGPATLDNISTRSFVQTGDNVMIGGFIIQGTERKTVIIRGIGPELTQFGVPNVLANPTLELHDATGALIASNDNWQTTIIGGIITQDQVQQIINSGHAPMDPREPAIIASLPAGNYTAIVRGVSSTRGVALVEVYDLSPGTDSTLDNISTRSFVQTNDNVMIGGFIVAGPKRVIVRAIGPELTQFGVPNVLADSTLELHNGAGALIASNDNWQTTIIGGIITHSQVQDIMNSGHAPTDQRESAIIADLPAGNYTAIVRGVDNTTGNALVEVYSLQ